MKSTVSLKKLGLFAFCLAGAGCGASPDTRIDTGAGDVGRTFFEALAVKDWPRAYDLLDRRSQAAWSKDDFAMRAEHYRRSMGFDPETVRVRSIEEHGNQAVIHLALVGSKESGNRLFRDAANLVKEPAGWRVSLPGNFGRSR